MADIIKTTADQVITGGGGTIRIDDTSTYGDLKILSIIPEADATFDTLEVVGPDGVVTDATLTIAQGGRNLGSMVANSLYVAGSNSYFKTIKLSGGAITCNKF
jgi:hypothetical protein